MYIHISSVIVCGYFARRYRIVAASDIPAHIRCTGREPWSVRSKKEVPVGTATCIAPTPVYLISPNDVKAVILCDNCKDGGALKGHATSTEYMDIKTLSRLYPISTYTGIDTLLLGRKKSRHKKVTIVFKASDGTEIPDPRISLEDLD